MYRKLVCEGVGEWRDGMVGEGRDVQKARIWSGW